MINSNKLELDDEKLAISNCHWCGKELLGLLAEFVHCVICNERRLIEGVDKTFDPCPVCMTVKSRKLNFLNPDYKRNGDANYD